MHSSSIAFDNYPEWYRVEKDTEKTIKKLTSIKELSPYLINSDEFIRRLAVLRVNELRLKDAVISLKEMLDDPLETSSNKELAAWTIKVISLHWNTDLFITNKYLNKYSGKERYSDVCKISIKDSLPSLKFDFTSSIFNSELIMENNDIRSSKEIDFDLPFSVKEWFSQYSSDIIADLKKLLIRLPIVLFKVFKTFIILVFSGIYAGSKLAVGVLSKIPLKRKPKETKESMPSKSVEKFVPDNTASSKQSFSPGAEIHSLRNSYNRSSYYGIEEEKTSLSKYIKKFIFYIFYVVFSPVRLVIKHKKFLVVALIALYAFLTFTTTGKVFVYKYTGLDLMEEQTNLYNASKEIVTYAWDEAQDFLGINQSTLPSEAVSYEAAANNSVESPKIRYRVLAKTGLNLRNEPNATSEKLLKLDYNSVVLYDDKSQDTSMGTWFRIKTADGTTGWVAAKYLEEIGGAENEGL